MGLVLAAEHEEDSMRGRFLTFDLDNNIFGIELRFVTEIISVQTITKIPEIPEFIKGVINLRGKIIPVIDMRLKFKKQEAVYTDRTCIIVVDTEKIQAGLIVDSVAEVAAIDEADISYSTSYESGFHNEYILGIGKVNDEVKLILDCEKLFYTDDDEALDENGNKKIKKMYTIK